VRKRVTSKIDYRRVKRLSQFGKYRKKPLHSYADIKESKKRRTPFLSSKKGNGGDSNDRLNCSGEEKKGKAFAS